MIQGWKGGFSPRERHSLQGHAIQIITHSYILRGKLYWTLQGALRNLSAEENQTTVRGG